MTFATEHIASHELDSERCRRARLSRDTRFDGEFFLGVKTTGIYCRPVCPARPPAEKNVRYFRHAAEAAEAGFRPCLRCRPESAPNSPAWRGVSTTINRALNLIAAGALNEGSVQQLATRLGVGERYLRKLFHKEMGVSPLAVAQNQRLLFAKKLLTETDLPMSTVAFSAGFNSIRRFNSAIASSFNNTPSAMRKQRSNVQASSVIVLQLQYRPPYDWEGVIDFFGRHAISGVEQVTPTSYQRNIRVRGAAGEMRVSPLRGKNALLLELNLPPSNQLMLHVAQVRRMFDLDANPQVVQEILSRDPVLGPLLTRFPGIRAPVHPSVYEATVRAIVGQQVSIQAARKICSRLAQTASEESGPASGTIYFPEAADLAGLEDIPMPARRRATLKAFCKQQAGSADPMDLPSLAALKGIGPWTTAMVAMRGHADPDIFPAGDLGLDKAYAAHAGKLKTYNHEQWRPWRSYAANLLWRSLSG